MYRFNNYRGKIERRDRSFIYTAVASVLLIVAAFIYLYLAGAGFLAVFLGLLSCYFFVMAGLSFLRARTHLVRSSAFLHKFFQICFIIWFISFIMVEVIVITGERTDVNAPDADYLVVLGAGLNGTVPSASLQSRLEAAADFLSENPGVTAIVTGGMGEGESITEASAMYAYLVGAGIDGERIIMEDQAKDTIQNIRYSLDIIADLGIENPKIAILSNDFHLYRARLIARHEGYEVSTVSVPSPYAYLSVTYHIREYFSLGKVFLTYLFT